MVSVFSALVTFAIIVALSVFFWFWWAALRDQVPPHLSDSQLKRLEVEDRLRQTNYQVLTAMGIGATFLITLFQFFATGRQWSNDYELKPSPAGNGRIGNLLYVNEHDTKPKEFSRFETVINVIPKTISEIFYGQPKKNVIDEGRPREGGPPEWKRYRCWVTDFRYADLRGANFEGGKLAGADLRNADLTGANLCRVDISRANFENAKGVTDEMINQACAGQPDATSTDRDAQPFGLPSDIKPVPRCPGRCN